MAVELEKQSELVIHGSSNVIPFSLIQSGDKLSRKEMVIDVVKSSNKLLLSQNTLLINVLDFRSDNKMAQRDFRTLMKSDKYPQLHLQVLSLELQQTQENGYYFSGNAQVTVTITNVSRQYTIPFTTVCDKDHYIIDGKKRISICDFGLEPPVKMMGLVKVSEWIEVNFHLICKFTEQKLNFSLIYHNPISETYI
ncbi:MAG: YceI family protein [Bacteroidales bacterium]